MKDNILSKLQVESCLLCNDAECDNVCPFIKPARIIRAVRFDNSLGAEISLPRNNPCLDCQAPCRYACPIHINIPKIVSNLYDEKEKIDLVPKYETVDISTDICGVKLENPFLLSSSVVASSYEMCERAFNMGWAGAVFKTISMIDMHESSPRFSALKNSDGSFYGFKNIEQLSDNTVKENLEIIKKLKSKFPQKVIVASIMGRNEEEWEYLSRAVSEAGADVIECNFSCPNMKDHGLGSDIGQDLEATALCTRASRRGTKKPLLVKLTPNVADMRPFAELSRENGADGIALINTVKSITGVNLDSFSSYPSVNDKFAIGGYSGMAVKPIALRFLAELAKDEKLKGMHLSGMGGIKSWRDAVEFISLGASSVQITTAVMEYGYRIIDDLIMGLKIYMAEKNLKNIDALRGKALNHLVPADSLERDTVVYPKFIREKCVGCQRCFISCQDGGHQAISISSKDNKPILNPQKCVGCHLCILVCPSEAIVSSEKRVKK